MDEFAASSPPSSSNQTHQNRFPMRLAAELEGLRTARACALKERGIYAFPDGTQVVACPGGERGSQLYYLKDWKLYGGGEVVAEHNASAFRLLATDHAGRILMYGYPTRWTVEDLQDTGRVAA